MYKQTETTPEIELENGSKTKPLATLKDSYGGVCQITLDDHCYVLCLKQENGKYKITPYIFPEAYRALCEISELETV